MCKNTCAEAGAAARAALKERAEAEAAGALLKEKYLAQAQETRATWAQEEARLAKSIAEQQGLVDRWKGDFHGPHTPASFLPVVMPLAPVRSRLEHRVCVQSNMTQCLSKRGDRGRRKRLWPGKRLSASRKRPYTLPVMLVQLMLLPPSQM